MSFIIKLLLFFSAVCFIVVGAIVYLAKTRGWDFLNAGGKEGQAPEVNVKNRRSEQLKKGVLKEVAEAKKKLAPGSEKSAEFFRSLGEKDPKLLAVSVKKWLSEEGDGKLEK
ncbi:hypothetical protein MNBD_NITROSPINAE03-321 [hydrothermal vent metagenome]|uniref:Uncharacterized protein n=1 Tax=hydrothermal vent metagenome TaxID=652676 RepID=A0A3B1CRN3_9ZZZZ